MSVSEKEILEQKIAEMKTILRGSAILSMVTLIVFSLALREFPLELAVKVYFYFLTVFGVITSISRIDRPYSSVYAVLTGVSLLAASFAHELIEFCKTLLAGWL
jgi:uncharacterized membrane protein